MPPQNDGVRWLVCLVGFLQITTASAADTSSLCEPSQPEQRRRPGVEGEQTLAVPCDPTRLPAPRADELPPPEPIPSRWRIVETLGYPNNRLDPYAGNNPIKGDRPVFGDDGFASFAASSSTLIEPRRVPTAGAGNVDQLFASQNANFDLVLYEGDTVFKPPEWLVRFSPAVSYTRTQSDASTTAATTFAVQSLFYEKHLRDVSPQYDFDSLRIGIQPMTTDFRGFLMLDQPAGVRFFGTRANNTYQYNFGWFRPLAKNAARLNDIGAPLPKEDVFVANLYRQDVFAPGFNGELVLVYDRNRAPTPVSLDSSHKVNTVYLGTSADGHVGRVNVTGALYYAVGKETLGTAAPVSTKTRSSFAAFELSRDFDRTRLRLSALHASGDADPQDGRGTAFVGLNSSPLFAGADASFFFHQRLPLTSTVDLKQRDRLFGTPSTSLGPGLQLVGLGADFDMSQRLRVSVDLNQLWFAEVAPLATLTERTGLSKSIGQDLSMDAFWRPFSSQNVIVRFAAAALNPARGFRSLYGDGTPYSVFINLTLAY